jgi:hypothetical protein
VAADLAFWKYVAKHQYLDTSFIKKHSHRLPLKWVLRPYNSDVVRQIYANEISAARKMNDSPLVIRWV